MQTSVRLTPPCFCVFGPTLSPKNSETEPVPPPCPPHVCLERTEGACHPDAVDGARAWLGHLPPASTTAATHLHHRRHHRLMRSLLLLLAWPATLAWQAHAIPQSRRPLLPQRSPALLRSAEELQGQPPLLPLAVLMLVPVAWGTFGVAVKTIKAKVGAPPPELAFSVMQYVVASSALGLLSSVTVRRLPEKASEKASEKATRAATAAAGFELGSYLFFGALLQLFGLGMTTATRGAFIVQLTTIIVPLMDAAVKRTPPSRLLLAACALAFGGVTAFVKSVPAGLATGTTTTGDGLIALSAVLYSLHVVRLSHHAPRIPPVALGRAKELTLH